MKELSYKKNSFRFVLRIENYILLTFSRLNSDKLIFVHIFQCKKTIEQINKVNKHYNLLMNVYLQVLITYKNESYHSMQKLLLFNILISITSSTSIVIK